MYHFLHTIKEEGEHERLLKLAVPPAYTDVCYAPYHNAHIQAIGTDSSQKRQYFYHEQWDILRDVKKFDSLRDFGKKLPSFRRKISKQLKDEDHPKVMVIAAMFRILDKTGIRVGSPKASNSYTLYIAKYTQ